MTTAMTPRQGGGGGTSGLYDVLELILDRGVVIDAFIRVSLVGIEILKIDIRIVVASVDTYLRFAEACNRLDLETGAKKPAGLTELLGGTSGSGGGKGTSGPRSAKEGAMTGVAKGFSEVLGQVRENLENANPRR
ncbi:gas vesicle protein GvpJ [Streptomyces sp. NPDC088745]|uniref:gas vesicle protein GvpJ n=1 Tax=Streptomyces sp. NPDC088745 TaxID=3365884 RepID=UPI00382ACC1F